MKRTPLKRRTPLARAKGTLRSAKPLSADQRTVRSAVFARDGHCLLAGGGPPWCRWGPCYGGLTPHHLRKASQGGDYSEANLVTLCQRHNDMQEELPNSSLAVGLTIARDVDAVLARERRATAGLLARGARR